MLTIQNIITEADTLVPNAYTSADKVSWLNAINQDFFSVVKIPKVVRFNTVAGQEGYTLPNDVRAKNIDLVRVGLVQYLSMMDDNVNPTNNFWTFDNNRITLDPAPYKNEVGIVRYHRIATTTFTNGNLSVQPDAPPEYHWIYTLGLCARIAKAQDDLGKATNYESDYRSALNTAAANYQKGVGV